VGVFDNKVSFHYGISNPAKKNLKKIYIVKKIFQILKTFQKTGMKGRAFQARLMKKSGLFHAKV